MNREIDEKYMRRCIQLARNGHVGASPNPMVGAVVVCGEKIIGEGFHIRCGEPHAEVNAIRSVRDTTLLPHSTVYVNLEPCSHYGKTPPCADMLIEKRVKRVVVGCVDPFAAVHGQGIAKLREYGVEVTTGVLEDECRNLNRKFIVFHSLHRPYIILKWACSADGFIAPVEAPHRTFISTPLTQMCSHRLRTENEAILVGRHTAETDNPRLTARAWYGRNPMRVVFDENAVLPANLHLFDGETKTLAVTREPYADMRPCIEYFHPNYDSDILPQLMTHLHEKNVQSLIVEGGRTVLQSFIDDALWDEIIVEQGEMLFSRGTPAPITPTGTTWQHLTHFGVNFRFARNAATCITV